MTSNKIHQYLLKINIISIEYFINSEFTSFWLEFKTLNKKAKSACYNFDDFSNKTIYVPFSEKPKGVIIVTLKYYQRL